jgi:hypothetical protein
VSGSLTDSGTVAVGAAALDAAVSTVSSSPASVTADGSASSTVTVTALDAYGNAISGLAASLGQGTGSSTIAPASTTTDAAGHAVFTVTDTLAETVTYQPTVASTLLSATAGVQFVPGAPDQLDFLVQPTDASATQTIAPAVRVRILDANGNLTASTATVALAVNGGATLAGTTSRAAVAGIATFDDLSIAKAGTGYQLHATSGSLTAADSGSFAIAVGPVAAGTSTVAAAPVSVTADGASAATVTVTLEDASGNAVPGKTVALTQPGGSSSTISAPSGASDANGRVTFSVTDTKG